jgi:hypothetical protein
MPAPRIAPLAASLLLAISGSATAACVPPPAGMVGWWPGDGSADDLVGGNPGTPLAGTSYGAGMVGQAFAFDGVASGVVVPEAGSQLDGFTEFSLDAWINASASDGPRGIVTKYDSRYPGVSFQLSLSDGRILVSAAQSCGSGDGGQCPFAYAFSLDPVDAIGHFNHVAGVWLGGNQFRIYWNGVPLPLGTGGSDTPPTSLGNNTTPVNIGRYESQSGSVVGPFGYFAGLIDEAEIFDRALSDSEVAALHAAGPAGKCKTSTLEVAIDIKPGSYPNSINLGASGVIPVAILSSATFDAAASVNRDSLTLAGARVRVVGKSARPLCSASDVNGDGRADLVCHFENELAASVGDATAVLEGTTLAGDAIHGEDSIRIVPD